MQRTIQILLVVLLCPLLAAQQPVIQSNLEPRAKAEVVTIPTETRIEFFLLEAVSSATAKRGQIVHLAAAEDFSVNGVVVIPKGTTAEGKVTKVRKGVPGKQDGQIDVEATSVLLSNGQSLRLQKNAMDPEWDLDCRDHVGPCVLFFIFEAAPILAILAMTAALSPITLAYKLREHQPSLKTQPAGTQMILQPCERISAYFSQKITIQPSGLPPASTSYATTLSGCGAAN